jgi:nucleotide-binding universal stress UspA family protein
MDMTASVASPLRAMAGRPDPIRRVLLGTDLSAVSDRAADQAIALATEHGAELIVLSVVDPRGLRLPGGRFVKRIDQERTRVEAAAQAVVARARAAGAHATFLVWEGDPVETIVSASAAEHADVVILGSHGRGRLARLVLGSISAQVAGQADCQVMVVPAGPASPEGD